MARADPPQAERLERLEKAKLRMPPLLADNRRWTNECEEVFNEFRVALVHLRRDNGAVDGLQDKEVVWRFICKLSRDRRPFWVRCEEVVGILMHSDEWMKAFVRDPETSVGDLPSNVIKDLNARCEEVGGQVQDHVRLVVVGCGPAAARHCALVSRYNSRVRNNFFRVTTLCDADAAQVAALQAIPEAQDLKLGACEVLSSPAAVLERLDSIDVALLCSHASREELMQAILARGKCMLVEPPLAASVDASSKLVELGRESQERPRLLLVAEPGGHWPEAAAASRLFAAEELGKAFGAEGHSVLPNGVEASELLAAFGAGHAAGCLLLTPGLRLVQPLRHVLGNVQEVLGTTVASASPVPSAAGTSGDISFSRLHDSSLADGSPEATQGQVKFAGALCILRHAGGAISSLRVQVGGLRVAHPLPQLVIRAERGDVVVEDGLGVRVCGEQSAESSPKQKASDRTPARVDRTTSGPTPTSQGSPSSHAVVGAAPTPNAAVGEDCLWDLFARQATLSAASSAEAREAAVAEVDANLEAHLADLRVLEALQRSFASGCFVPVEAPAPQLAT